ncbi:hypothetical protein LB503_011557 [Fusarium chuoi]|nr:hypothetical protein LB503_011557 [Fusarium chuoi]
MASNNKVSFLESLGVEGSILDKQMRHVGGMIIDLVNRTGQIGQDRAVAHSAPIIAELKTRLEAANGRVAQLEACLNAFKAGAAQTKADADARVAQHTSDLEARNVQMVNTVTETVEKMKRDAAARVATAETHAQACIDEHQDKTDSQIRQLSRDLELHRDMVGLARKLFQAAPVDQAKHVRRKAYRMGSTQTVST